jgi:peptide deformylase
MSATSIKNPAFSMNNLPAIIEYPNPLLREKSVELSVVDEKTRELADTMLQVIYSSNGIGLAAVQIGVLQKVIVVDIDHSIKKHLEQHKKQHHTENGGNCNENHEIEFLHGGKPLVLINPRIIWASEELFEYEEGCLSLPGLHGLIKRPAKIKVEFLDLDGKPQLLEASNLLSTCIQHEIDHSEGIIFPDRVSPLKKEKMLNKYIKEHKKDNKKTKK